MYEDDPNDPNFLEIPVRKEPKTKVLYEMSMFGAKINMETKKQGLLKLSRTYLISIQCCETSQSIELMFNSNTDQRSFFEWNKCIKESEEILTSHINRLCHVQFTLLSPSTVQNYKKRSPYPRRKPMPLGKGCNILF